MGIVPVVLAAIVLAFSLQDQRGALSANIVPDAFNGAHANATMEALSSEYPSRRPGSDGDRRLADHVGTTVRGRGVRMAQPLVTRSPDDPAALRPPVLTRRRRDVSRCRCPLMPLSAGDRTCSHYPVLSILKCR